MNIREKLKELVAYYEVNRGVGHTTGMVNGIKNTKNPLVLTWDVNSTKTIKKSFNLPNAIPFQSINGRNMVRGYNKPLFIDNAALYLLFRDSLKEIEKQDELLTKHPVI